MSWTRARSAVVAVAGVLAAAMLAAPADAADPSATQINATFVVDGGHGPVSGPVSFDVQLMATDGYQALPGKPMTLSGRTVGSSTWSVLAHVITDAGGYAAATVSLRYSTQIRWDFAGDADYLPSTMGPYLQEIDPRVSARVSDHNLLRGQRLVVTGRSFPAKPGRRVTLWSGSIPDAFTSPPAPTRLASGYVRADGSYRLTRVFRHPGPRRLFVKVEGGFRNGDGFSNYARIRVR